MIQPEHKRRPVTRTLVKQTHHALDVLEQSLQVFATAGYNVDIDFIIQLRRMLIVEFPTEKACAPCPAKRIRPKVPSRLSGIIA